MVDTRLFGAVLMGRLLAMIAAFGFLIWLLFTDLDNTQRWLLTGVIWMSAIANWDRR